ncbi:MAG: 2'-5' RNA ligase family protein [bacterium]
MAHLNMDDFLAVVSYPDFNRTGYPWIEEYRRQHDDFHGLIAAHFSFVFPVSDMEAADFLEEIKTRTKGFKKFDYRIRCAIRNNDLTSDYWHVLLVPDEGFSEVVKLHSALYSGRLRKYERLDLDFIPHVGIANSTDPEACKRMVDEVNAMDINIRGTIDRLDIIQYKDRKISTISVLNL